jgi:hypothetical protein
MADPSLSFTGSSFMADNAISGLDQLSFMADHGEPAPTVNESSSHHYYITSKEFLGGLQAKNIIGEGDTAEVFKTTTSRFGQVAVKLAKKITLQNKMRM